ncbi:hypothetical protein ABIC29_003376 [Agromyces sp. PvR057]
MRRITWSLYGLATVLSVFLVLMNAAVGALDKSYLIIGLLLIGSGLTAVFHVADTIRGSVVTRMSDQRVDADR